MKRAHLVWALFISAVRTQIRIGGFDNAFGTSLGLDAGPVSFSRPGGPKRLALALRMNRTRADVAADSQSPWGQPLYCARFSTEVDDDCVEASLVAAVGGAALAVSVLAELVVEPLVDGVNGADATEGSTLELGVEELELDADSVFKGAKAGAEL